MGIAEILAAKKAAAAGIKTLVVDNSQATDIVVKSTPTPTPTIPPATEAPKSEIKTLPPLQKPEEAPVQVEKPLSFAEKMALKKQQTISTNTVATITPSVPVVGASLVESEKDSDAKNVVAPSLSSPTKVEGAVQLSGTVALPTVEAVSSPVVEATGTDGKNEEANPELQQAYADISHKIEQLEALEDTDLEGAMRDLKKALMANPNAVALMHDTDYGKMVIALRRITKEAQIEAVKEKKTGTGGKKSQRNLILSQEDVEAVFNEL